MALVSPREARFHSAHYSAWKKIHVLGQVTCFGAQQRKQNKHSKRSENKVCQCVHNGSHFRHITVSVSNQFYSNNCREMLGFWGNVTENTVEGTGKDIDKLKISVCLCHVPCSPSQPNCLLTHLGVPCRRMELELCATVHLKYVYSGMDVFKRRCLRCETLTQKLLLQQNNSICFSS